MNIKSLLLGSAAALAVVSGAQAADAVVAAEPEPMEYVKVCDAYGTGFFYIPGTETCLKIGGQFRYEKNFENVAGPNTPTYYYHHSRVRLDFEAKNDSEWGTVYSWVRLQGDQDDNGTNGVNFFYYFGIGGLEFGNYDLPWSRFFGYGGLTDWGGDDGFQDGKQYISYTANLGSVSAWISLDNDANQLDVDNLPHDNHKYIPDVSGGVSGTFGDYTAYAGLGYDESLDSLAVKAKVSGSVGMFSFAALALYSDDKANRYFNYDGFSAIVGVSAKVTDSITLAKDFQYWDNGDWMLIADVAWSVAPGFSVLLEGAYKDLDAGGNEKYGMLRFERSF
ncbi:porin [Rhizobium alvei]|uniref:Porin n=2 Tax=Rhizobium alvei TaxID=1132659 RepID=A0ABT8YIR2_9HYPH|nr:porin [Rhizobium alvei]MDO6963585.1 porin [Rhizobium alvei]